VTTIPIQEAGRPQWVTSYTFSLNSPPNTSSYQLLGLPILLHSHPALVPTLDISSVQRFAFRSSTHYLLVSALSVSYCLPAVRTQSGLAPYSACAATRKKRTRL